MPSINMFNNLSPAKWDVLTATVDEKYRPYIASLAEGTGQTGQVKKEHLPALRAIIKNRYPTASIHERAKLEDFVSPLIGPKINSYLDKAQGTREYSDYANAASKDSSVQNSLDALKLVLERSEVQGSEGFSNYKWGEVGGKPTLTAYNVQAATSNFDVPIPNKVLSAVEGDFFSYRQPDAQGVYNGMYLNEKQWEKDIHFGDDDNILPRSGNDQLYFPGFVQDYRFNNEQAVSIELQDNLELKFNEIYASKNPYWDPLKDFSLEEDAVMQETRMSHFTPAITLLGDISERDPDGPQRILPRLRPAKDSWKNPYLPSPWRDVEKVLPSIVQFDLAEQAGFMLPNYP